MAGRGGHSVSGISGEKKKAMNKTITKYSFLIPSIADILLVSIFLFQAFRAGIGLLADCDTGYHIRTGEYILRTLSVPRHDLYSFITPPIPWVAHEWLSEVVMALVYKPFGLTGVVIFFAYLIAFIYYLLFRIVRRNGGNILAEILVILLVITSSEIHWLARPHIFSLLLLVIWYFLLDEFQYRNGNYLYLLPLLMLLWVNLHGGFIIGFVLSGIYFLDNVVKGFLSAGEERRAHGNKAKLLGISIGASLLASLVNPHGYHILLFPFTVTSNTFLMNNVQEFLSPNFHESMPFKYLLFLLLSVFALKVRKVRFAELALVLLFLDMALYSARYIPLFAIIVMPIVVRQMSPLLDESPGRIFSFFRKRAERIGSVDAAARGYLWPFAAFALVAVLALNGAISFHFDEKIKPVAAVRFLRQEHIKGNMFNNDEFGDYIIYAASDRYKVFFDGRSDMYGVKRMKEYFRVARLEEGWDDVLKKYDINWIIYDNGSTLSRFLLERKDWKLIYSDRVANIFVKNIPQYAGLIERYGTVLPFRLNTTPDPKGMPLLPAHRPKGSAVV
jgi:hypothetical protein